ncbi:PXK.2 family protein [Megaselia abdita]
MRPEFIAERRKNLQEFLNIVYHMNPILASSLPAKRFVDPDNYAQSFHDNAVQNSSLCLRNEGIYVLSDDHYSNIGWRLRKQYFKVVPKITEINKPSSIRNFVKQSHRSQSQQSKAYVPTHSTTEETKDYAAIAAASVNCDLVMGWIEYGPDKYIEDRDVQDFINNVRHFVKKCWAGGLTGRASVFAIFGQ